jgi:hypothetical protein
MTSRARALAVFGAYLCLATHLAGVVHVLVVRHATCPGHGEIIHSGAPVAAQTPPPAQEAVEGIAAGLGEEQDEHCLLLATRRRELAGLTPVAHEQVRAPAATPFDSPPVATVVSPRALLLSAPKTSPPRAAV